MFNMIVNYNAWADGRDTISAGRVFEHTEDHLVAQFKPNGHLDFSSLVALPTLFVQESSGQGNEVARVGTITRARLSGSNVTLDYVYDLGIPGIPNRVLQCLAGDLDIDDFQFSRTHWSVKDTDLFRVLVRGAQPKRQKPTVFILPDHENIEPTLVSAMMPFHHGFDRVYEALQAVAEEIGLRCRRADDIWENPAVMQDVVSLIDRSRVVIADCTGRNPNVFYEIGIAHTLGREVILITQNKADIPFDLRHLRYVQYLNNGEGLAALSDCLRPRLADLA
ncbi:MAG: hypothetical protein ACYCY2_12245 [Acidithiobacillus ferriphilus]|uniref:hypothetical protein n=1 Tax=Acidithiobacillus ferriphilus TaxID=1689834 RepID=UPI001C078474|nr:hypothetical protein [Acidithiobacillus ferriphilus]MBU2827133.1 hypothetical protein [Acidithiobacillus ferriphilus]